MTTDKQVLVDVLEAWVFMDRDMLNRKIKKAEWHDWGHTKEYSDWIRLSRVKYNGLQFKEMCRELCKIYLKYYGSVVELKTCVKCGKENVKVSSHGNCYDCSRKKRIIICVECGMEKQHAGYGYCWKCLRIAKKNGDIQKKGAKNNGYAKY